jgi:radical SAM superfamily enzyme with C-terminal helix-hairpin-helix motif
VCLCEIEGGKGGRERETIHCLFCQEYRWEEINSKRSKDSNRQITEVRKGYEFGLYPKGSRSHRKAQIEE